MVVQQESTKRAAMEQRLHSQLLLQNENMVAMELKNVYGRVPFISLENIHMKEQVNFVCVEVASF